MIETKILLPAIALYAETHFRFGGWTPSALFRREPEIVFDLPRRLVGGRDLPVVLMINEVHRYPVSILSVQIAVSRAGVDAGVNDAGINTGNGVGDNDINNAKPVLIEFDQHHIQKSAIDHPLKKQMQAYVLTIPREKLGAAGGEVFVNACLRFRRVKNGVVQKRIHTVLNDNLVTSTKFAYRCFICDDDYPGSGQCVFGDLHCHSMFSRSHVEWGPPFEVIDRISAASGLDFAAMTDHSYDLACDPENFLRQDRELRLWEMYKSAISNYKGTTAIIPAEEVSVLNSKGKVVHLCGLGLSEYIPGTLDGARKSVHHKRQLTIKEAVDEIKRQGGVSFAAHPGARAGFFQSVFLKRGVWREADLVDGLGGVQAVNSSFHSPFGRMGDLWGWARGVNLWKSMIQKGLRVPLLAGSDAHGDFNRYRAVGVPFWQIYEGAERYMGSVRTGVYGKRGDINGIINGIRDAATFVTNGPFLTICDARRPEVSLISSKTVSDATNLTVRAASTKEIGAISAIIVFIGRQHCQGNENNPIIQRSYSPDTRVRKREIAGPGANDEITLIYQPLPPDTYEATVPIPSDELPGEEAYYLRAVVCGNTPRGFATTAATSACFVGD